MECPFKFLLMRVVHITLFNLMLPNFFSPWSLCFFTVVGSGQRLKCERVIRAVAMSIQGLSLVLDLYVFFFYGVDVVLGVAWLE